MLSDICQRPVINREDTILAACLDGHIADRKAVIHREVCDTVSDKLHRLVACSVDTDHSDNMEDDILPGYILRELSSQIEPKRGRNLEPGLSGCHAGCHVRRPHACRKCTKRTVRAGMGVCADHDISCCDKSLLRQECMLDPHLSNIIVVADLMPDGKLPDTLAVLCRLYILVRDKVIHDKRNFILVKYTVILQTIHLSDRNRRRNVIAKYKIELCLDQLSRVNLRKAGCLREYLLSHCHSHIDPPYGCYTNCPKNIPILIKSRQEYKPLPVRASVIDRQLVLHDR